VCSLDRLIVTQDSSLTTAGVQLVDGKMDLSVYADVVDIRGPILLPDRSVKIFARKLCSSVDSRNQPARIDTSGLSAGAAAGREQKKAKLSPAYGGETCVTALGFHMGCEKQGGDGKTGDPGKGGANGDRGGNAWEIEITCGEPDPHLRLELIARGGRGQDG